MARPTRTAGYVRAARAPLQDCHYYGCASTAGACQTDGWWVRRDSASTASACRTDAPIQLDSHHYRTVT